MMREHTTRIRALVKRSPAPQVTTQNTWESLRAHATRRAHEVIDEVPGVLRRLKTFLLVGSITMIAFAAGMLVVLWHAVR
jgi:phage terminase large subunit GpA-like protein